MTQRIFTPAPVCFSVSHASMDANGPCFTPNNPLSVLGWIQTLFASVAPSTKTRVGVSGCIVAMNDVVLKHLFVCLNVKTLKFLDENSKLMSLLNGWENINRFMYSIVPDFQPWESVWELVILFTDDAWHSCTDGEALTVTEELHTVRKFLLIRQQRCFHWVRRTSPPPLHPPKDQLVMESSLCWGKISSPVFVKLWSLLFSHEGAVQSTP